MNKQDILNDLSNIAHELEKSGHIKQANVVNEVFEKTAANLLDTLRNNFMKGVGPQGAAQATQMAQNAPQLPAAFQKFFRPIGKGMTTAPQMVQPAAQPTAPVQPVAQPAPVSTKPSISQIASDIADGKMKFSQLPAGLSFDDKTRIMMMANQLKKVRGR